MFAILMGRTCIVLVSWTERYKEHRDEVFAILMGRTCIVLVSWTEKYKDHRVGVRHTYGKDVHCIGGLD